jgi:hypothetical protein
MPMRRIWSDCCARAARSQTAPLPNNAMNSRLLIQSPRRRGRPVYASLHPGQEEKGRLSMSPEP